MALSQVERNKRTRERKKAIGLRRREVWILPEFDAALKEIESISFEKAKEKAEG